MSLGEQGGVALREFKSGSVKFAPGTHIPAELAMTWPEENRGALERTKFVQWAKPLIITDQMPGAPAPRPSGRKQKGA